MYKGWQVWDGQYRPVEVGGEVVASVEFVQRSALRAVDPDSPLQVQQTAANRYRATATVLHTTAAVVLDLGAFRALRWVRPGEGPGAFEVGSRVALEVGLGLNGWPGSSWTSRAAELHGTDHKWYVRRILRVTTGRDESTEIAEASMETVDSSEQYCLLECSLVDQQST